MLPLDIASLAFDPSTQRPVLLLKLAGSPDPAERLVPITLGRPEAHAIISAAHGITFSRPMTHDLLVSIMQASGLILSRVEIGSFSQGTFLATLDFLRDDNHITLDARPSDAIALALRTHAPLFIADNVYQETSVKTQIANAGITLGIGLGTGIGGNAGSNAEAETDVEADAESPDNEEPPAAGPRKLLDDFHEFIQHVEPGDFA